MYELPTSIEVNNREFAIENNGDFRMVMDCFSTLRDEKLSEDYRVLACLLIFYNEFYELSDLDRCAEYVPSLVKEMFKFFNCGQIESPGADTSTPLVDWEQDSNILCAAINNVAKTEIRVLEYLHWWTYMGYYLSIDNKSVLATVVSIRDKIVHHKNLEKWEKEFKKSNPSYFIWKTSTVKDREAEQIVREIWNNGGG